MNLPFAALAMIGILYSAGCSRAKEGDNFTHVQDDDNAMNVAIATAKATVNEFVAAFAAQKPGTKDFYVKKPYMTPSGDGEHMWILVSGAKDGIIDGRISNEAEETKEVTIGQEVQLRYEEISDWKYQDGNKLIGGYTIRYFVDRMTPDERKEFFKEAGFEI